MERSWNAWLWVGFLLVLAGLFSYLPIFVRFPLTRDFPWVNLLLCAAGLAMLGIGLARAFARPEVYRGKIFGTAMMGLGVLGVGAFCWGLLYEVRQLPASASAPRVGQKAPDFTLPDQDGKPVALADLLASSAAGHAGAASGNAGGVLLIFYRGHW